MDQERRKESIWHVNAKDKPGGRLETLSFQTVIRFLAEGKRLDDRFPKELGSCINDEPIKTLDLALTVVHAYLLTHLDELFEDYRFYPVFKALVLKLDFFKGNRVDRRPLKEAIESIMLIFPPDYMLKLCLKFFGEPTLVMGMPSKIMAMYVAQSVVRVTGEQVPLICEFIEIDVLRRACSKIIDIKVTSSRRPTLNRWSEDVLTALWYMNRREMVQVFAGLRTPFQRIVIEMISTYGRTKHKSFIQNIEQQNVLTVANLQRVNLGLMPIIRTELIREEDNTHLESRNLIEKQEGFPSEVSSNLEFASPADIIIPMKFTPCWQAEAAKVKPSALEAGVETQGHDWTSPSNSTSGFLPGDDKTVEDNFLTNVSSSLEFASQWWQAEAAKVKPSTLEDEVETQGHDLSTQNSSTSVFIPGDDKTVEDNFQTDVSSNLEFASPTDIVIPMKFTPWWQAEAAKVKPSTLEDEVETQGHDLSTQNSSTSVFIPGDDKTVEDNFQTDVSSNLEFASPTDIVIPMKFTPWWQAEAAKVKPSTLEDEVETQGHDLSTQNSSTSVFIPGDDKTVEDNFQTDVSSNLEFASPTDIVIPMKFTPWWQAEAAKVKPSTLEDEVETQGHDLSTQNSSTSVFIPGDDKTVEDNFQTDVSSNLEFASPTDIVIPMKFTPWWQAEAAKVKHSTLEAGVETQGHDWTSPSNSTSEFLPGHDKTVEDNFQTDVSINLEFASPTDIVIPMKFTPWHEESAEGEPSMYKGGETSEREPSTLKTSESSPDHEPLMRKAEVSAECEPSPPVAGFNETVSVSRLKSIMSIPSKIGLLIKKGRFQSQATVCEEREGEKTSINYTKEWKKLKDEIDCLNNEIYSCKVEITTVEYEAELFRNQVRLQNELINSTQQKFTKRFRAVNL